MLSHIRAERLKWRHTFVPRLLWITPLFTMLLCAVMMGGQSFQGGAYNWWYAVFLPGALTLTCSLVLQKDAKMKYHGLLALPFDLRMLWAGKILACAQWLLVTLLLFLIGITAGGVLFGQTIPVPDSVAGSFLIFATFLWQIPLCLFLAARFGLFAAVLLNMSGTVLGIVTFDTGGLWNYVPYTITARLMCPVLSILPNGLPVPADSPLRSTGMILPDTLVSLAWFGLLFFLTAAWFRKREAN
ncbi:lantibiotic immunity ABC transporter MutE/EpiE family permease subunit [Paenibacillus sp. MMS20-IR301]|uniref:lantibiotic immunity ABC transporter MutE/EpiE family permease subunit n=1 Tax=Paenibacillus sp. MMS20-IR301 TaxID=2895946 RepID=UPI0028E6D0A6|nr:lantibiotic immunity ABC transporter MutE/EpiE family permease subunit [Paenibacillus sp. MMS20-IR301]WNS42340.1 lantibiotic immunity ABC transporter MutE/EpiE family permease subunit [Paenibacillus sp. MMS20-IR301]